MHAEFPRLPIALSTGLIPGDANVGNVLTDTLAKPVLIDVDNFATSPREWDPNPRPRWSTSRKSG